MKVFKTLGKSKLASGLLAAAAVYFLGSYLAGDDAPATEPPVDLGVNGGLDPESALRGDVVTPEPVEAVPTPEVPQAAVPQAPQPPVPPPVSETPPQTTSTPGSNLGSKDGGIIAGAAKWFKDLSPGAQQVLAASVAGGATGMMQALAQKNAMDDARDREERVRQDRIRRTTITPFAPNSLIGSRMG